MVEDFSDSNFIPCTPPPISTPDGRFGTPDSSLRGDQPEFLHSVEEDVVDLCTSDTEIQPKPKASKITDFLKPCDRSTGSDIFAFEVSCQHSCPQANDPLV